MKRGINRRQFGKGSASWGAVSIGAVSSSLALTSTWRARAQAEPVKIRIGWVVVPASTAPLVLEKKDILTHFGKSYIAEATRFEGTPPVITALAAGQLDVGPLAFSSFGLAVQNARMDDLRVISALVLQCDLGFGQGKIRFGQPPAKIAKHRLVDLEARQTSRHHRYS